MSAVEQNSSGFWSSLFGSRKAGNGSHGEDQAKTYKPVTFRPGDKSKSSADSTASTHFTQYGSPALTAVGNSCNVGGKPVFPAAATLPNGNGYGSFIWKPPPSNNTVQNGNTSSVEPLTSPLTGEKPLYKPEPVTLPSSSFTASAIPADEGCSTLSSSYQWAPKKSAMLTSQNNNHSAQSVKSICKQWPPKQAPEDDSPLSSSSTTTSKQCDLVPTMQTTDVNDRDEEAKRGLVDTTSTRKVDEMGQSRGSSLTREIENCLTDEWWDSLFAKYNNDGQNDVSAPKPPAVPATRSLLDDQHSGASNGWSRNGIEDRVDLTATSSNERSALVGSTAAVLRLSNALQRAPVSTTTHNTMINNASPSVSRKIPPPTLPKDRVKIEENAILQEWKVGLKDNDKIKPRTQEYLQNRGEPTNNSVTRVIQSAPVSKESSQIVKGVDSVHLQIKEAGDPTNQNLNTPKPVKFEGIGPTDSETGVPIATRTSVDEENRKDWYRCMYKSLHKVDRPQEVNPYLNAYILTEPNTPTTKDAEFNFPSSPSSAIVGSTTLDKNSDEFAYPPHARYRPQRYKNQPKRIEDYEPGCSSLAEKQVKTCESERLLVNVRCVESDADADYRSASEADDVISGHRNKRNTRKPVRKVDGQTFRQQWDQENRKRREEIDRVIEAERQKRFVNERKANEANRHSDFLNPIEKTKMLLNRFDDEASLQTAENLQRPHYKAATRVRGKAKALYSFRAQNSREMSLKKGDTVYLLRQVDKNWFKGERHGAVGIFPVSYVEVLTSLEQAQVAAGLREGQACAKYNFKGQNTKELSLRKGDVVTLVRRLDDDWYEARVGGRQGIVPVIYVELAKEPDTPFVTPMSSRANTPVLGNSTYLSPASSVISLNGPDLPSRPTSPWISDFYDSEVEVDRDMSKSPRSTIDRNRSRQQAKNDPSGKVSSASKGDPKANYVYYRSQNIIGNGVPYVWPSADASALDQAGNKAAANQRRDSAPRDLYELARQRRQSDNDPLGVLRNPTFQEADWRVRSQSLPRVKTNDSRNNGDWNNCSTLQTTSSNSLSVMPSKPAKVPQQQQPTYRKKSASPAPTFKRYQALYAYAPRHVDELEIREGDVIEVMETCDDGWFVGTSLRSNDFGTFPGNYVRAVD